MPVLREGIPNSDGIYPALPLPLPLPLPLTPSAIKFDTTSYLDAPSIPIQELSHLSLHFTDLQLDHDMGGIEIERKGEGEREKRRKIDRQDEVEDEGISRSPLHTGDSLFGTARLKSRPLGALRSGTTFVGTQKALGREPYSIKVTIHDVDLLVDDKISGYLECSGLLPEPVTTFFDGDIIGPKHTFRTLTAGKPPTEYVDLAHWSKFPAFRSRLISPQTHLLSNLPLSTEVVARDRYAPLYNTHKAHDPYTSDYIFMRWKEKFLVPDYKETISGASFCGWYYVCFRRSTGHISGFYYHANSELYQELELCMEEETGFGEFEWR